MGCGNLWISISGGATEAQNCTLKSFSKPGGVQNAMRGYAFFRTEKPAGKTAAGLWFLSPENEWVIL